MLWSVRAMPLPGLSPRVRGSPLAKHMDVKSDGSIPACAGEPNAEIDVRVARRVYPRVCGGAASASATDTVTGGLSPRVRGSP